MAIVGVERIYDKSNPTEVALWGLIKGTKQVDIIKVMIQKRREMIRILSAIDESDAP